MYLVSSVCVNTILALYSNVHENVALHEQSVVKGSMQLLQNDGRIFRNGSRYLNEIHLVDDEQLAV